MSWLEAASAALEIQEILMQPLCVAFVDVCGSIRRKSPTVNDVDIVVVTETTEYERVWSVLYSIDVRYETKGQVSRRFYYRDIKFDVRICKFVHRGAMLLTRTGPAKFNIAMRSIAKKLGYKLNEYGVWLGDSNLTEGMPEEKIFEFLNLAYVKPEDRGGKIKVHRKAKTPVEWRVMSSSGKKYYVVKFYGEELTCTCPGFNYRRSCRHVNEIARKLEEGSLVTNP